MELPNTDTLKKVAESVAATQFVSGKSKPIVKSVTNIISKRHPRPKDALILEFSADTDNISSNGTVLVSALMKRSQDDFSSNEFQLYSTLLKDLQQTFGSSKQTSTIYGYNPHAVGSIQDGNGKIYEIIPRPLLLSKPYIFLENLESETSQYKRLEFGGVHQINPLDLDFGHCLLAVETLAKLHATTYIFRHSLGAKGKGKLEMLRKYPFLSQTNPSCIFSPSQSLKLSPRFEEAFDLALTIIEAENPSLAFKLRRKVPNSTAIFDKCVKLLEEEKYDNDDFYVMCCGNFLPENLLYSYEEDNTRSSTKVPKECKIANVDSAFFGPLGSEIALFMLISTNLQFRMEFEEKLLAFYCDAFQEQVRNISANSVHLQPIATEFEENIDEFHRKLEKQYRKMLEFGFYNVCHLLPLILFKNSNSSLSNNINHESGVQCTYYSLRNLIQEETQSFKGNKEFENFALNNLFLRERLMDILKQLGKYRVLL